MVRFVIYKNSILATICSMIGAVCIAMAVGGLFGKEIGILPGIAMIAVGLGLMFLASIISEHKEKKKRAKAAKATSAQASTSASNTSYAQPKANPCYTQPQQVVYAAPAASAAPVKKSPVSAGIFFLLTAVMELAAIGRIYAMSSHYMVGSGAVVLVVMSVLLTIAAFRTKHIQQVSILFVFGFLGLALDSANVALSVYRAYGWGGYSDGEAIHYAVAVAPALKAAAFLLMGIFALLSTRKIKESCGGIVRWLWFIPMLPLLLVYSKEIADNDPLQGILQTISRHGVWPGLDMFVHPILLDLYAIVFQALAVLLSGVCFRSLCKKSVVSYQQAHYVQPEPQSVYSTPVQETPVQPQSEPPKRDDAEIEKQIQAYKDLLDCGILSQEEYDQKVRELM